MSKTAMRILQTIPFFTPTFGGSVVQTRARVEKLAARGHHVSVVTTDLGVDADTPRNQWIEVVPGLRVFHATATKPLHRVPPYVPPSSARRAIREAAHDTDVVCANVGLTLWNDCVRRCARRAGIGYIYNAEGALCPTRLRIKRWSKTAFLLAIERRILKHAAVLQALTPKDREDLLRLGAPAARIEIVPNGIETAASAADKPPADQAAARKRLGLATQTPTLTFFGRLHAIKGVDLLLQAAAPLLQDGRCQLLIAGPDDGELASLTALAGTLHVTQHVHFVGLFDEAARSTAFVATDIFALTSRTEGQPLGPLEAAAAGLPLLLTQPCNLPEVTEWDAGAVTSTEPSAIRDALEGLLVDPDRRTRCGNNARAMAESVFAIDRVVDRFEGLLQRARGVQS